MPLEPPTEQESHAAFLGALNALGGSAGNGQLRELLEWDEASYHQVKASLVASRSIVPGRGRGGSVALASLNGGGCHVPVEVVAGTSTASSAGVAAAFSPNGSSGMSTPQSTPPTPAPPPAGGQATFTPSHWIAPPEKDGANRSLEKSLWEAADQFRANSSLKAQEYLGPILGLIFLRFAEVRFLRRRSVLAETENSERRANRLEEPGVYHADGVLYLEEEEEAPFGWLLNRPEGGDIGALVNDAMRLIEQHNDRLAGVLPKTYNLFTSTLLKQLLKKFSEIPATVDSDAFGRIYECLLGEFARTEGQKGGEFYTPSSMVRLLTEVIDPFHGGILDPACGSGGMFVQSENFVERHGGRLGDIYIYGQGRNATTRRLAVMNLALRGIKSYFGVEHADSLRRDLLRITPPSSCWPTRPSTIPTGFTKTTKCSGNSACSQGQRQLCLGAALHPPPHAPRHGRLRSRQWQNVLQPVH